MKSPNQFFTFLLLSLVLILSIQIIFLKYRPSSQIKPTDISNWQTYSNPKYAFTLLYPPAWEQTVDTDSNPYFRPVDDNFLERNTISITIGNKPFTTNTYVNVLKDLHFGDFYYRFQTGKKSDPKYLEIYNQIISSFNYKETDISQVSRFPLPPGLEYPQIQTPQKIGDYYFVTFLKSSMNSFLDSSVQRSGVLTLRPNSSKWQIFYEINDKIKDSASKNNPYQFWQENNFYYTMIADTGGAGSGEGIGKLIRINPNTNKWQTLYCFYFNPGSYYKFIENHSNNISLSQRITEYDTPFSGLPRMPQNITSPQCTNFILKIYPL